jgi:NADH dehydrogenase FAD-containing subunit
MKIYLIEAVDWLLSVMSKQSSDKARGFLEKMGVNVIANTRATGHADILTNNYSIPE